MLCAPPVHRHVLPVVALDGERHAQHRVARLDNAQDPAHNRQPFVRSHSAGEGVRQTAFHQAGRLVVELTDRVHECAVLGGQGGGSDRQVTATGARRHHGHGSQHRAAASHNCTPTQPQYTAAESTEELNDTR